MRSEDLGGCNEASLVLRQSQAMDLCVPQVWVALISAGGGQGQQRDLSLVSPEVQVSPVSPGQN